MQLFRRKFNNVDLIPANVLEINFYKSFKISMGIKSRFNVSIWSVIAASAIIILVYPFLPLVVYNFSNSEQPTVEEGVREVVLGDFTLNPNNNTDIQSLNSIQASNGLAQQGNRIIIPKIGVNIKVSSANNESEALAQGAFHFPNTSTPDRGGNSAFSAHRYQYFPPHSETFYLLDKLQIGDKFSVFWNGKEYQYKVSQSLIVSPYTIEVLDPTDVSTVTLITCNPLFSTKERLVVKGELIELR